jgi:hypothetical protein
MSSYSAASAATAMSRISSGPGDVLERRHAILGAGLA